MNEPLDDIETNFELIINEEKRGLMFWYRLIMNLFAIVMFSWAAVGFYSLSPLISILIFIPTLLIGFPMSIVSLNSFSEKQKVKLDTKEFKLTKNRKYFAKEISIPVEQIVDVKLKPIRLNSLENFIVWLKVFKNYTDLPAIESKGGTYYFGEFNLTKVDRKELIENIKRTQHNTMYMSCAKPVQ